MKKRAVYLMTAVLVMAVAAPLFAQVGADSKADPRLLKALNESGLKWNALDDGDFKLQFNFDDDRSHLVFAESATQTLGIIEVREVWAIGWKGEKKPSALIANRLLIDNSQKKVGAWELLEMDDGTYIAIFNVKVSADCSGAALKSIIHGIAEVADEMEKELLTTDDY